MAKVIFTKILCQKLIVISFDDQTQTIMRENDINQYKADIYSSINHNLKTPLNGIIPLVQICLESNNIILIKKNLDIIFSNSKMLVCMVQDIIDINKIRSKSLVINPHTFQLSKLLDQVNRIYSLQFYLKNLEFVIHNNTKKNNIFNDQMKIKQITINLLTNSLKYSQKGKVELSFDESIIDNRECIKVIIKDQGIGFNINEID